MFTLSQRYIINTDYFNSRDEVINDLYIGSVMVVVFKYVYRMIKKTILRIKKKRVKL